MVGYTHTLCGCDSAEFDVTKAWGAQGQVHDAVERWSSLNPTEGSDY
jgi:hypothetical protein